MLLGAGTSVQLLLPAVLQHVSSSCPPPHPSQQAKDLIFNIHMGTTGADRCHKALLSEFCPEKENCFFRLKADDYTLSLQEKLLPNLQLFAVTVCRYTVS